MGGRKTGDETASVAIGTATSADAAVSHRTRETEIQRNLLNLPDKMTGKEGGIGGVRKHRSERKSAAKVIKLFGTFVLREPTHTKSS